MESLNAQEPNWILDRSGSGPLFWRRDSSGNNLRVKFRYDVEVKEFRRGEHEFEDAEWTTNLQGHSILTMGMTCLFCVAVTVVLPWYVLIGTN